jgi:hypothetical protein
MYLIINGNIQNVSTCFVLNSCKFAVDGLSMIAEWRVRNELAPCQLAQL